MKILLAAALASIMCSCVNDPYPELNTDPQKFGVPPLEHIENNRYKHRQGFELFYSEELEVFSVVAYPNTYYAEDVFYRFDQSSNRWQASDRATGPWKTISADELPGKLGDLPGDED